MEILTLQRRLVEVGRIRLGHKKTSASGTQYPARLEKFRLTTRDKVRLEAAASLYGGDVVQWNDGWELYTDTDALPVAVVPGQALNQSFELWGQKPLPNGKKTGVICLRRCDGMTEALTGESCRCAREAEPVCKPTTRLSVVLTEVPGIGVWRVEAHGWNAAAELSGSVRLLEALVASGRPVRARLRLDPREQVTESETRHFVVPVLDIDHTLSQVLDSIGPARHELESGVHALPAGPSFQPVPESLPSAPVASIADQTAAVADPQPRSRRANAAEPLRPTGLKPRPAAAATTPAPESSSAPTCARCGSSLAGCAVDRDGAGFVHKGGCPTTDTASADGRGEVDAGSDVPATPASPAPDEVYRDLDLLKLAGEVFDQARQDAPRGQKSKIVDRLRHALTWAVTEGRTQSLKDATAADKHRLWTELTYLKTGFASYRVDDDALVIVRGDKEVRCPFTDEEDAAA